MNEFPILMDVTSARGILCKLKWNTRRLNGLEAVNDYDGNIGYAEYQGLCGSDYFIKNKRGFRDNPNLYHWFMGEMYGGKEINPIPVRCPYGWVGDLLWCREAWRVHQWSEDGSLEIQYKVGQTEWFTAQDGEAFIKLWQQSTDDAEKAGCLMVDGYFTWPESECPTRWRPSIHMYKWLARLWLKVIEIKPEPLQDISDADILAEGITWTNNGPLHAHYVDCSGPLPVSHNFPTLREAFIHRWDGIHGGTKYEWNTNPWVWAIHFDPVCIPKGAAQ